MWRLLGNANAPLLGLAERCLSGSRTPSKSVTLRKGKARPVPPTPLDQLEKVLEKLQGRQGAWDSASNTERAALLRSCIRTTIKTMNEAAEAALDVKGSTSTTLGEELLGWMPVVSGLRELAEALDADGSPSPQSLRVHPTTGQVVADVFPLGIEAMLYAGFKGEVWIEPGKPASQGEHYRQRAKAAAAGSGGSGGSSGGGPVSLVLGAGNQVPVVMLDILHKLVVDGRVVVVKMNPVNEYMGPFVSRALQPLADQGYVEVVYGGLEQGSFLSKHPAVADIHLTGSPATFDAIVWGPGNKDKTGDPPFSKPVSAELGCVTPYIVVPGPWSQDDLTHQAELIVSGVLHNCGHNCLAAELLVTDASWALREQFLDAVRDAMDRAGQRDCYYPGSDAKVDAFVLRFPDAERRGMGVQGSGGGEGGEGAEQRAEGSCPLLFKTGLSPEEADTQTENWAPVLQEVALQPSSSSPGEAAAFLRAATHFANERCFGTLSCAVFIHPTTQAENKEEFDQALVDLRYGSISINCPGVIAFAITKLMWGAYPGHTLQDIQSGNCAVHNTLLFDHPQKSVLHSPWRYHPYPPWSVFHANMEGLVPKLASFFASPSLLTLLPVPASAVLG